MQKHKGLLIFLVFIAFVLIVTGSSILLVSSVVGNMTALFASVILLIIAIVIYGILGLYFLLYFLKKRGS